MLYRGTVFIKLLTLVQNVLSGFILLLPTIFFLQKFSAMDLFHQQIGKRVNLIIRLFIRKI